MAQRNRMQDKYDQVIEYPDRSMSYADIHSVYIREGKYFGKLSDGSTVTSPVYNKRRIPVWSVVGGRKVIHTAV